MSALSFESILIKAPTEAAAFAAGLAIHPALAPLIQDLENFTWSEHPDKRLDLMVAAAVAAENVAAYPDMQAEAAAHGFNTDRFAWAYGVSLSAPGTGELLTMLRRQTISAADFTHGLRKAKRETRWDDALTELQHERLDPAVIAVAIQRGIIPDPGILPVAPPSGSGKVPSFPVFQVDAVREAAAAGVDLERLSVMVGNVGLPASAQQAASAYFRGIIELDDYYRAISEGNTRNEWRDAILNQARQILTADQYVEGYLRGWTTEPEMFAGTGKHGMSAEDTQLLYDIRGRPINVHAITTALARGGKYGGNYANVPEPYNKALRESNIRPEWGNLAYANRYTYPSAFVLRALAQAGELGTTQDVEQILLEIGWKPELAAKVAPSWAPSGQAGDTHVAKAEGQLWTTTHRSYIAEEIDDAAATTALGKVGVASASIPAVLALWQEERSLVRAQLTPAQIRKAMGEGVTNPATGASWTMADAVAAMVARGYTQADATVFMQS